MENPPTHGENPSLRGALLPLHEALQPVRSLREAPHVAGRQDPAVGAPLGLPSEVGQGVEEVAWREKNLLGGYAMN